MTMSGQRNVIGDPFDFPELAGDLKISPPFTRISAAGISPFQPRIQLSEFFHGYFNFFLRVLVRWKFTF